MSLEESSDSLEGTIEQFNSDLDDAEMIVEEMEGRATFEEFASFDELRGEEAAMIEALKERYDFNPDAPAKVEEMDGTPGTAGEGKIQVSVYTTNKPAICIAKYQYADGSVGWSLRPLDFEE